MRTSRGGAFRSGEEGRALSCLGRTVEPSSRWGLDPSLSIAGFIPTAPAALRRFKRSCEKAGILTELRRREFYEKPTQERKRKKAAAVKRHAKRVAREASRGKRLY